MKLYLDTETVGLMGPVKLIQYSIDRGPVQFIKLPAGWQFSDWGSVLGPMFGRNVLQQLEELYGYLYRSDVTVVTFNGGFDLFKLYQLRQVMLGGKNTDPERLTEPFTAKTLDLYTHAVRVGPFAPWAFSKKKVVQLRRVPAVAKELAAQTVEKLIAPKLPAGVTFKRSEHRVKNRKDLVTLSWVAKASNGLKSLAEHFSGRTPIKLKDVWPLPDWEKSKGGKKSDYTPWLPYWEHDARYAALEAECDKVLSGNDARSQEFFQYAADDITNLFVVEDGLKNPSPDHHDAAVECVAFTRYFGFELDQESLSRTVAHYKKRVDECERLLAGVNLRSSKSRLAKLKTFNPLIGNSSKLILKDLTNRYAGTELARVAEAMLGFGAAKQRLDQALKLSGCQTRRAHPDLRVMGTSTKRMAGTAGFNYQGIAQVEEVGEFLIGLRAAIKTCFGGDFSGFELAIAASAWNDEQMLADLTNKIDIHTAVMCQAHPDIKGKYTYEQANKIRKDKNHPDEIFINKCRNQTKRIVFGILYGAAAPKINEVLEFEINDPRGQEVLDAFFERYKGAGAFRKSEEKRFLTADVERWTNDSVSRMARSSTNLAGSTRHFDFECDVAAVLWQVGRNFAKFVDCALIPTGTIIRQDIKGQQSIKGAVQSAFLGGAMAIQATVCRAAINDPIQSTGAELCKMLMAELWFAMHAPILQIHDEYAAARHRNWLQQLAARIIDAFMDKWRPVVRHIGLDYKETELWADK